MPYLFLKPTRGAIIGSGQDVIMPFGRDRIEWEVELAVVFGRAGKYISASRAYDHVFGYMVAMDVSDRGGRRRVATAPVRTGSSVRAMTLSRPRDRGLFQRSSTEIPWSACTRVSSSMA